MRLTQLVVWFAVAAFPVWAQRYEVGPYVAFDKMPRVALGTTRVGTGSDTDTQFGDGKAVGVRLTLNTKGYYGHEVHYVRSQILLRSNVDELIINPDFTITVGAAVTRREKIRQSRIGYNFLMYMMPAGERWRPYITVGAFSANTNPPRFLEWTAAGGRNFGGNVGGGLKLFPTKHVAFRVDYRYMIVGRPFTLNFPQAGSGSGGNLKPMEISAGFSWAWGK